MSAGGAGTSACGGGSGLWGHDQCLGTAGSQFGCSDKGESHSLPLQLLADLLHASKARVTTGVTKSIKVPGHLYTSESGLGPKERKVLVRET